MKFPIASRIEPEGPPAEMGSPRSWRFACKQTERAPLACSHEEKTCKLTH